MRLRDAPTAVPGGGVPGRRAQCQSLLLARTLIGTISCGQMAGTHSCEGCRRMNPPHRLLKTTLSTKVLPQLFIHNPNHCVLRNRSPRRGCNALPLTQPRNVIIKVGCRVANFADSYHTGQYKVGSLPAVVGDRDHRITDVLVPNHLHFKAGESRICAKAVLVQMFVYRAERYLLFRDVFLVCSINFCNLRLHPMG